MLCFVESEAAARSTHSERLVQFCTTDKGKLSIEFGLLDEMIKELEKNNTSSLCILKTMYGSSTACKDSEVRVFDNRQSKEMQGCNNIYTRLIDKLCHCYRWDVSSMLSMLMLSVNSESCLNLIKSFSVKVNSKIKLQQIYEHCKLKGFEIPEQFCKVFAIEDGEIFSNITLEKYHVLKCFVSALYGMEDYVMSSFIKASFSLFVSDFIIMYVILWGLCIS